MTLSAKVGRRFAKTIYIWKNIAKKRVVFAVFPKIIFTFNTKCLNYYIFVNCLEFSSTLIFQTNLGKQVNCGDKKKNSCAECADFTRDDWCGGIDCKWDYPSELCVPKGIFIKNGFEEPTGQ